MREEDWRLMMALVLSNPRQVFPNPRPGGWWQAQFYSDWHVPGEERKSGHMIDLGVLLTEQQRPADWV